MSELSSRRGPCLVPKQIDNRVVMGVLGYGQVALQRERKPLSERCRGLCVHIINFDFLTIEWNSAISANSRG